MIEECKVCRKIHDTEESQLNGITYKICPDVPPNEARFGNYTLSELKELAAKSKQQVGSET